MRLLLLRHGETAHNAQQLALGQADVPLTDRGRRQAQAVASRLGGEPIAAVYSSPLRRAVATATPLADARKLAVQTASDLIEMAIGEMDGLTFAEVRERYPEFLRLWLSDQLADAVMPGGESLRQVQARVWAALESIRARHAEETVAVVTHNFVILSILCQVLDLPLARFRVLRHDLAAVSVLELTPERAFVVSVDDRCHHNGERRGL